MNAKTLGLLVVAAGATVVVAALVMNRDEHAVGSAAAQGLLLPQLEKRVNDVASIRVQRHDGSYTLHRAGDAWGLQEKGDYPVPIEQVSKLVQALARLEIVEAKTADPARYEKLGVQDFDAPGSTSTLLALSDAGGEELARLVVGKEADLKGAALSNQVYVRKAGEAQSWLVKGRLDVHPSGADWLSKEILKVPQDRVQSVEIRQPDGETLLVDRASRDVKDFTLHDVPEGKELTYPTVANALAGGLEWVNLEDVVPAGDVDFSADHGPIARYVTFDGLVITVTTKDQDGKAYASFVASYEAPPAVGPEPPAAGDGDGAESKPETAQRSPEEVRREVDDLNARLSKWTYVISSYSRTQFGKKKSELLKDKAPPPGATPAGDGADPDAAGGGSEDDQPVVIPGDLPKEIQDQIKAHQESLGNKVIIGPAREKPAGETPPNGGATPHEKPDDGATAPEKPDDGEAGAGGPDDGR